MERESSLDHHGHPAVLQRASSEQTRRVTLDLKTGSSSVFMTTPREQHRKRQSRRLERAWTDGQLLTEHSIRAKTLPEPLSDKVVHLVKTLKKGVAQPAQGGNRSRTPSPKSDKVCKKTVGRRVTISELATTNDEAVEALLEPEQMHTSSGSGVHPCSPGSLSSGTASDVCSEEAQLGEASGSSDNESYENPEERRHVGVQRRASEQTMVLGLKSLASRQQWRYSEPVRDDSCQRVMLRKKVNGEARRFTEVYARTINILEQHMTLDPPTENRHSVDLGELRDYCSNYDEATPPPSLETTMHGMGSPSRKTVFGFSADQFREQEATPPASTVTTMNSIGSEKRCSNFRSPSPETMVEETNKHGFSADQLRQQATALGEEMEDTDQQWLQVLKALKTVREESVIAWQNWVGGQLPACDWDATSPLLRSDSAESPVRSVISSPRSPDPVQVVKNMMLMKQRMLSIHEQGGPMEEDAFVAHRSNGKASPRATLSAVVRKANQISRSLSTASAVGSFVSAVAMPREEETIAG